MYELRMIESRPTTGEVPGLRITNIWFGSSQTCPFIVEIDGQLVRLIRREPDRSISSAPSGIQQTAAPSPNPASPALAAKYEALAKHIAEYNGPSPRIGGWTF